jgi:hypothetical protein
VNLKITGDLIRDAALGRLAATVRAWERGLVPQNATYECGTIRQGDRTFSASINANAIEIDGDLALALEGAFCLYQALNWLPGAGNSTERPMDLLPVHQGLLATFLQHSKKEKLGTEKATVFEVDDQAIPISYRECQSYAHQGPFRGRVTQDLVPGITEGADALPVAREEEFLLRLLCVACPVFSIPCGDERFRTCLVIPRVRDLRKFAIRLHRLASPQALCFGVSGRFAAGARRPPLG